MLAKIRYLHRIMTDDNIPETALEVIRYLGDLKTCHEFWVGIRWPKGVRCPHCDSDKVGKFSGKRMVSNCKSCKKQFTAKVGSIFEDSPIPLTKWIPAVWFIVNAKNGISSCELARSLGVTQKTAWYMGHRIRKAVHAGNFSGKLEGIVEVDETFVGGLAKNMHKWKRDAKQLKTAGRSMIQVQGFLQRDDECSKVAALVLPEEAHHDYRGNIDKHVAVGTQVFTDKAPHYRTMHRNPNFIHESVDHRMMYVLGDIHTNSLENFWSLFKRGLKGTYVHVSRDHIHRYLSEQVYRFNERKENDSTRFVKALRKTKNLRLTYRKLTGKGNPALDK
jgi:transposase-like protein